MAAMLETPSRIWRRIEAIEDRDMPSLPSLSHFEDSDDAESVVHHDSDDQFQEDLESISSRIHSTPTYAHHTITSTIRPPSSTSSTARFANSLTSRSNKSLVAVSNSSRAMSTRRNQHDSFEVPSLPRIQPANTTDEYLEDEEDLDRKSDLSMTDALESVSRSSSPPFSPEAMKHEETPKKNYDYSVSLKSEPKASPFEKYRNVALRRTNPHARTPSLSRTSSSRTSSPTHSTPQSNKSLALSHSNTGSPTQAIAIPLPRSTTASPDQPEDDDDDAALPRPRARFDLPPSPGDLPTTPAPKSQEVPVDTDSEEGEDPLTPHTRRRSFLLNVINSTARPRMKFPTPHPRRFGTPSITESTPRPGTSSGESSSPGPSLQAAFVTQRIAPSRRMSHPLSQTISPSSHGMSGSEPEPSPVSGGNPVPWATPAHSSPYDGTPERASFISTASSHDLTTHHRINTSFDTAMGFGAGAPGHGVGRFNATKLNNYLHGLNRRLQEENENLIERLKKMEELKKEDAVSDTVEPNRRSSGVNRRASSVGTSLGNVQEHGAEGWVEEMEDMVEELKTGLASCMAEKEELERVLEQEKEGRERDEERWRERMTEVEQGVSGIIAGLEQKLRAAEKQTKKAEEETSQRVKEMEKELVEIRGDRDVAMERASKAERVLASGKDLGGALKEANERVTQVMSDLRNANAQIKELEEEVMQSDGRIDDLEKDLREDKDIIAGLEEELTSHSDALATDRAKIEQLKDTIHKLDEELTSAKVYMSEMEDNALETIDRIKTVEGELASAQATIESMSAAEQQASTMSKALEEEATNARELARQMEAALEEAEKKMMHDEELLDDLQSKLTTLERERQREADASHPPVETGPTEADLQAMENELDGANREIARLTALLSQSPARKAMEKAKHMKIEMLEKEKEELLERNRVLRMTFNEMNTPNKLVNASGISPIHRQVLSMSVRAPKTPGGPLRDISWLNNSPSDPSVSPLVAEIHRLQGELDRANESIDDKLDKLEDAGMGVVGLTKKLEDTRSKVVSLEDEIARLTRREDRRMRRLARARCQKCSIKLDLQHLILPDESSMDILPDQLPHEPPTPPTRTSEALKANLQSVNKHLDELRNQWEGEKKKLLGEKAILEDAANRLNGQVKSSKDEASKIAESNRVSEKSRANAQSELDKAKRTISVLEKELGSERSRLRSMITEQDRMQREKKQVLTDLQRTESDMDDVKQQLQRLKKENHNLEKELRENATIEQKARLLETRVVENAETIENLRQERSLLATDHKALQRRFAEISETANNLRDEYAAQSQSHDNRRHELDLHRLEIDDLRRTLDDRANELQRVEKEKDKITTEKIDVAKTVASLEADLKRVRRDAEVFGQDLKLLRMEKDDLEMKNKDEISKTERSKKQAQTQIRLLKEQLETQKEKTLKTQEEIKNHTCAADERQVSKMKLQHNKECKGLIVQIRYLKAKFVRESLFRSDLTYQKQYLLVLLTQFEKSEQTIFASIARIGFPVALPPPRRKIRKLKSVALTVVFLSRVKRSSTAWKEHSSSKQAVVAALEDVRRRRTLPV